MSEPTGSPDQQPSLTKCGGREEPLYLLPAHLERGGGDNLQQKGLSTRINQTQFSKCAP